MVYAIDGSSTPKALDAMKRFISEAILPLPIENGTSRVSLIEFNTNVKPKVNFGQSSKPVLSLALDTIERKGGQKDIIQALEYARNVIFKPSEKRPAAKRVVVLLMEGDDKDPQYKNLDAILRKFNQEEIKYVIVDIGGSLEGGKKLKDIGGKYGRVVLINKPDELQDAIPAVLKSADNPGRDFIVTATRADLVIQ